MMRSPEAFRREKGKKETTRVFGCGALSTGSFGKRKTIRTVCYMIDMAVILTQGAVILRGCRYLVGL